LTTTTNKPSKANGAIDLGSGREAIDRHNAAATAAAKEASLRAMREDQAARARLGMSGPDYDTLRSILDAQEKAERRSED
jgi:hypothetical protein